MYNSVRKCTQVASYLCTIQVYRAVRSSDHGEKKTPLAMLETRDVQKELVEIEKRFDEAREA